MDLTDMQKDAIKKAEAWYKSRTEQVFTIAGYAGTGKTTIITELVKQLGISIVCFATFTGKASLVLTRKRCPSTTIHQLIYTVRRDNKGNLFFVKKDFLDTPAELIVIDEVSMVSLDVMEDLLSFGVPIILIGDPEQIPPVGEGRHIYLSDPDVFLTEIHRQAEDNLIIKLSMDIRTGDRLRSFSSPQLNIVKRRDVDIKTMLKYAQVICGKNNTRNQLNAKMREYLGFESMDIPEVGDKLVCLKNNWGTCLNGEPLINGMVGFIDEIQPSRPGFYHLNFKPDYLDDCYQMLFTDAPTFGNGAIPQKNVSREVNYFTYGYAITCHKAQGSEYDSVVLLNEPIGDTSEDRRRWLYTGVTRAQNKLLILL